MIPNQQTTCLLCFVNLVLLRPTGRCSLSHVFIMLVMWLPRARSSERPSRALIIWERFSPCTLEKEQRCVCMMYIYMAVRSGGIKHDSPAEGGVHR